jgi:hypothetical protein
MACFSLLPAALVLAQVLRWGKRSARIHQRAEVCSVWILAADALQVLLSIPVPTCFARRGGNGQSAACPVQRAGNPSGWATRGR